MDTSNQSFRQTELFDAIITDPPYGIRALARKVQKKEITPLSKEALEETKEEATGKGENIKYGILIFMVYPF